MSYKNFSSLFNRFQYLFVLISFFFVGIMVLQSCTSMEDKQKASGEIDRTVLPVKPPTPPLYTELDVRNATPPPHLR